jgi:hypothetical protein
LISRPEIGGRIAKIISRARQRKYPATRQSHRNQKTAGGFFGCVPFGRVDILARFDNIKIGLKIALWKISMTGIFTIRQKAI